MLDTAPGTFAATRVVSTDNGGSAFSLANGVSATLVDVRGERSGADGAGVKVVESDATIQRAFLVDNSGYGILATGAGTVTATDVYVAAPGVTPGVIMPAGVAIDGIDAASLSRVLVEDAAYIGILGQDSGAISASDVVVRRIAPDSEGTYGIGIVYNGNDTATLDRAEVSDTRLIGVNLAGDGAANDLRVSRTTSSDGSGYLGIGVFLEAADVTGARWVIEDSQNAGLGLNASDLTVSDLLVDGVEARPCVSTTCPEDGAASGVYVDSTSELTLSFFVVQGAVGVGVQSKGSATVADGYVRDGAYGTEASGTGVVVFDRLDVSGATAATPDVPQPVPTLDY